VNLSAKAVRSFVFSALFLLACCGAIPSAFAQTITVTSANPNSAAQGTVNLNVTVSGSGFKKGAQAKWFVTGTTNPGGVTVNSTAFNSSSQLTANITVAADATVAQFDILVANINGRTGKGTELFAVTANGSKTSSCPVLAPLLTQPITSCTSISAGCLDTTFGGTGLVTTDTGGDNLPPNSHDDEGQVPLIEHDGSVDKIVVAGFGDDPASVVGTYIYDVTVVRYNLDGTLDTTFGAGGIARAVMPNAGVAGPVSGAALQPDGKIVVTGFVGFIVVRFNSDGTLDSTFGSGGMVTIQPPKTGHTQSYSQAYGLALQSDGKIVVSGYLGGYAAVVRLNSDGTLDNTFGSGGEVIMKSGVVGRTLAIQNLTVGGNTEQFILAAGDDFSMMRLGPGGSLDPTFGPNGNGQVTAGFCGSPSRAFAITFDASGNIVLAGYAEGFNSTTTPKWAVVRFTAGGILDTTFGSFGASLPGKTAFDFLGGEGIAEGVAVQPADGKIVVSGWFWDPDTSTTLKSYMGVARLNSDGTLDTSFGTGGVVGTDFGTENDYGAGVVLQPDGTNPPKILVTGSGAPPAPGTTNTYNGNYFGTARYWP
jgi:uncharacterized delta-60 repeat protein